MVIFHCYVSLPEGRNLLRNQEVVILLLASVRETGMFVTFRSYLVTQGVTLHVFSLYK